MAEQGLGWTSSFGSGKGDDTISSGLEGAWTTDPIRWDNVYFELLFTYDWELTKSPAGAYQWHAKDIAEDDMPPAAHDPSTRVLPIMATTDLSLKFDPIYKEISQRFYENPDQFAWIVVVEDCQARSAPEPSRTVPAAGGVVSTVTPSLVAETCPPTPLVARTVT